jgi:16S rRNA (guanine527-N7)-methyltransferase
LIDSKILQYSVLEPLNVSRETFEDFEEYSSLILSRNKKINLIGRETEKIVRHRHIIDSAQIHDFIDKNEKICTDIGSGSGLPGIVLAIIMKHKKISMKFNLYEKSFRKTEFLNEVINKFNLNAEVFQKNIFEEKNLVTDTLVSRAFKPLPTILDLVSNNFKKLNSIILFLGKSGKEYLPNCMRTWNFEYKEKKSLTNPESKVIKIYNLKKK